MLFRPAIMPGGYEEDEHRSPPVVARLRDPARLWSEAMTQTIEERRAIERQVIQRVITDALADPTLYLSAEG